MLPYQSTETVSCQMLFVFIKTSLQFSANKKYLQGQAKLPPKKTYDEAKKCQESGKNLNVQHVKKY